ncbi:PAAR domain-containing protein [Paraburkholderia bannensis]|uniref:PAAR domain-containing protein n=1 Tax=Paraburkholderia bannensis TaxID=765414 RepID=UPI002AB6F08B|nr:PAAR domain-containing protein [Paraburkholderia bannensis]
MRRRIAVVGDILSTSGSVVEYPIAMSVSFYGHQPALIGGDAFCEICRSMGKIVKAGGMNRRFLKDREIALDGDQVVCKCSEPPQIVALLARETWHEDQSAPALADAADRAAAASENLKVEHFSEQFTLKDVQGRPLAGALYTLKTAAGVMIRGVTDGEGRTGRYTSDGEQIVAVYLGHRE